MQQSSDVNAVKTEKKSKKDETKVQVETKHTINTQLKKLCCILSAISENHGGSRADLGIPYEYYFNAVAGN